MENYLTFLSYALFVLLILVVTTSLLPQQVSAQSVNADLKTVTIDLVPRVSTIIVDDRLYLSNEFPLTFSWAKGSTHRIIIEQTESEESPEKRFVFQRWTDLSESPDHSFTVTDNINLRAIFKEEYRLNIITDQGTVYGQNWYEKGQKAVFGVRPTVIEDKLSSDHRYSFASWSLGDSPESPTNSIIIEGPTTVKATWYDQYYLEASSSQDGSLLPGTGWYFKGQKAVMVFDREIDSDRPDMKYMFDGWANLGEYPAVVQDSEGFSTVIVDHAYKIGALWKKGYFLTLQSEYGTPEGSGFYKEGSVATVSLSSNEFMTKYNKEKTVFDTWNGKGVLASNPSGDGQIRVTEPVTIIAKWKTEYYLNVLSSEGGGAVSGSGWYDAGSVATLNANEPADQATGFWTKIAFDKWTGDFTSGVEKSSVTIDSPKTIKAEWKVDYMPAIMNGLILAGVGIAAGFVLKKARKSKRRRFEDIPDPLQDDLRRHELSDAAWKSWRAKLVKRGNDDFDPKP